MVKTTKTTIMIDFFDILADNPLTSDIFADDILTEDERNHINSCIRTASYQKEAIILHSGDITKELGIVLSGSVRIESIDFWGNRAILNSIPTGHIFAESYAISSKPLMVDAVSAESSEILFIDIEKLLDKRNQTKSWYIKLVSKLLRISTAKNIALSERIFCTSPKSIRARVMTYLTSKSIELGENELKLPFDRQQMADYLNVDRTALSKELGKMKDEGILDFRKNKFILHKTE